MTAVVVFLGCVVTFATVVCGHHRLPWPVGRMARSAWAAVRRTRRCTRPLSADLPIPALIASRRRPQPSWVLPVDLGALNASHSHEHEKEPAT